VLASTAGTRTVVYADFCTGYRETQLRADELIAAIRFPRPAPGTRQLWRKVGTRRAQSISKVMLAAAAIVDRGLIVHVRLGLGAVAARPIRAVAAEAAVVRKPPGTGAAALARAALAAEIAPIDDVRSTATYRLVVAQNLVARFIVSLAE
jgi:xanthine dehydrogenase small subunit